MHILLLENQGYRLAFDDSTGDWISLNESAAAGRSIAFDFNIDGHWMVAEYGKQFTEARRTDNVITFEWSIAAEAANYRLTSTYAIVEVFGASHVQRSATVTLVERRDEADDAVARLHAFRFDLPCFTPSSPDTLQVEVPGPWIANTYVRPGSSYPDFVRRVADAGEIAFHSAPDGGFGAVLVSEKTSGETWGAWMDTAGEAGYIPQVIVDPDDATRVLIRHEDRRGQRLDIGRPAKSDTQIVVARDQKTSVLAAYRHMVEETMPPDVSTPDWVKDMVILEVFPNYFPGGYVEIAERLPFYASIGFNTIYLMPHWLGGYGPMDQFTTDPTHGTAEELCALVRRAHELGMHFLFDMVIHGFDGRSSVVEQQPELFARNADGSMAFHPAWRSASTDWASPAYQRYMAMLAIHDLETYNIDGYRVDAASFKPPNWDPAISYAAYTSGASSPAVMSAMFEAMRRIKPESVLLSEVFGPVFLKVCNLDHDNQAEAPEVFIEHLERGEVNAHDYKAYLRSIFTMLPPETNRVFYTRNHDTSWFYHFGGYRPAYFATEAVHALCAIPEVFAGDPNNSPNPDDDPNIYAFYQKLFAARNRFPGMTRARLVLDAVETANTHVFTAARVAEGEAILIAISFSPEPESAALQLRNELAGFNNARSLEWFDVTAGTITSMPVGKMTLVPWQAVMVKIER